MIENLTWRAATAEDAPLLFKLFAANKAAEFAPLGLSAQQLQPLLEMQFRARQLTYSQNYANALDTILCLADGTPIGRHLIDRQEMCYHGVDLAVLPEYQNQGVGSWAMGQIQKLATVESIAFRLSVVKSNPALRLYQRLGFVPFASDELFFEMEWKPAHLAPTAAVKPAAQTIKPEEHITLQSGETLDRSFVIDRIFAFLREIGIEVHLTESTEEGFLPGIQLVANGLNVNTESLLYPGDLLHEAGHLAVMPPSQRHTASPMSDNSDRSKAAAEEMAAMSWSYAAALHIGLPPEVVFHQHGYKGQSDQLLHGFATGNFIGLPYLWWIGMTTQAFQHQPSIYPRMTRWLREEPVSTLEPELELAHSA